MVRQSDAENFFVKRLGFTPRTTDPIDTNDGDMWYRSDLAELRYNKNGVVVDLLSGSGSGIIKYELADLDITQSSGPTLIFTTENNGKRFHFLDIQITLTDTSEVSPTPGYVFIGTDDPNYGNLTNNSGFGTLGLNVVNSVVASIGFIGKTLDPNTDVKTTLSTPSPDTTAKAKIIILGFYS